MGSVVSIEGGRASCLWLLLSLWVLAPVNAAVYELPAKGQRLVGALQFHRVVKGDFFQALAEQYNVGLLALIEANPGIDPLLPPLGEQLVIPTAMLLPPSPREGIVINLPELRLYYYAEDGRRVFVYPVGIGRAGHRTPLMHSFIGEKRKDPAWYPPAALRQHYLEERGVELPKVVPPGDDNPLGRYAMRMETSEYLIHGTNQRFGIGMSVSSGCVRLYPADIEQLFDMVSVGTPVRVINQPIKWARDSDGNKLVEIHSPLPELVTPGDSPSGGLPGSVSRFIGDDPQGEREFRRLLANPRGMPAPLGVWLGPPSP